MKLQSSIKCQNIYSPIVCATKDRIYIANSYTSTDGKIFVYDYDGHLIENFGAKGKGPGEFSCIIKIFYNNRKKLLGVYDVYSFSIQYFDENYKFVCSEKLSKVLFNIISTISDSQIYYYRYPKLNGKSNFWNIIEMTREDSIVKIIREKECKKKDMKYYFKNTLRIGANQDNIFIWDINDNAFSIEQYNIKGYLEKIWDLKIQKRHIDNIKMFEKILVGDKFLLLSFINENDIRFYEAYDFSEKYLGTISMQSENDKIGCVYNDLIFYLKYCEQDDNEYYNCKIYKINK